MRALSVVAAEESFSNSNTEESSQGDRPNSFSSKPAGSEQTLNDVSNVLAVIVGSIAGTVARVLLQQVPVEQFPYITDAATLPNIVGNLLLGFNQYAPVKKPHWDVLWETGFCGSLTSWASWVTTMIKVQQHEGLWPSITNAFITFGLLNLFYQLGRSYGHILVDFVWNKLIKFTLTTMQIIIFYVATILLTYILVILSYTVFYPASHRNEVWELALCVAPFGALIRYFLAKYLNTISWFPLGTLVANFAAVFIDSFLLKEQKVENDVVANAFKYGFIGTLGTLSRWTKEQHSFTTLSQQWFYGAASLIPSILIAYIIMRDY